MLPKLNRLSKTPGKRTPTITMYALAYNLVRATMCQAAGRQGVVVDRVSFIDALRWLRGAEAREEMPELVVNPWRPGRC
jgi:hypothetical protein